jgi:tetratricopeptide (TPR) repeat protein
MEQGKMPYARRMLEESVEDECPYFTEGLRRELAILRKRAGLPADIPGDGALILRGEEAIARRRFQDALRYLQAEDIRGSSWDYLMGEALFGLGRYAEAAEYYTSAEEEMPRAVRRRLQLCYAELKDFEKAYRYATMGMDMD